MFSIRALQADRALASPSTLFRAYTLLLAAERATEAHRIASEDLVPEALVRNDLSLVRRLLEPFLVESAAEPNLEGDVSGWNEGGRVYLLFLSQPGRPDLLSQTVQAVQGLSKRVRGSNRLKSKKLLRLAVAEMESRLMILAKASPASSVRPLALRRHFSSQGRVELIDTLRCNRPSSGRSRPFSPLQTGLSGSRAQMRRSGKERLAAQLQSEHEMRRTLQLAFRTLAI